MRLCRPILFMILPLMALGCRPKTKSDSESKIVGGYIISEWATGPERLSTVGLTGCTGTLIAEDLILTAAHCYDASVRSGYALFGVSFNSLDRSLVKLGRGIKNEKYLSAADVSHDLAMFKIDGDLPQGFSPVRILSAERPPQTGDEVMQVGYGSNNIEKSFGILRKVKSYIARSERPGSLLVRNGRTAACSGDSGGPLYIERDGSMYTAGVASTANMNGFSLCTGGNTYVSLVQPETSQVVLKMAQELTGRERPFDVIPKAVQTEDPQSGLLTPVSPRAPTIKLEPKFAVIGNIETFGSDLKVRLRNNSGGRVRKCKLALEISRKSDRGGETLIRYPLLAAIEVSEKDQEHNITLKDELAAQDSSYEYQAFKTLTVTCAL